MFYMTLVLKRYRLDLLQSRDDGVPWELSRGERYIRVAAVQQILYRGKLVAGEPEGGKEVADVERGEFAICGQREDVAVDAARERGVRSE